MREATAGLETTDGPIPVSAPGWPPPYPDARREV